MTRLEAMHECGEAVEEAEAMRFPVERDPNVVMFRVEKEGDGEEKIIACPRPNEPTVYGDHGFKVFQVGEDTWVACNLDEVAAESNALCDCDLDLEVGPDWRDHTKEYQPSEVLSVWYEVDGQFDTPEWRLTGLSEHDGNMLMEQGCGRVTVEHTAAEWADRVHAEFHNKTFFLASTYA